MNLNQKFNEVKEKVKKRNFKNGTLKELEESFEIMCDKIDDLEKRLGKLE